MSLHFHKDYSTFYLVTVFLYVALRTVNLYLENFWGNHCAIWWSLFESDVQSDEQNQIIVQSLTGAIAPECNKRFPLVKVFLM